MKTYAWSGILNFLAFDVNKGFNLKKEQNKTTTQNHYKGYRKWAVRGGQM